MAKFLSVLGLLCVAFYCCEGGRIGIFDNGENENLDEIAGRQLDELAQPKILIPFSQKIAWLFSTTTQAPTTAAAPAPAPAPAQNQQPANQQTPNQPAGNQQTPNQPGGNQQTPNQPGNFFMAYALPSFTDGGFYGDVVRRPNSQMQPIFIVGQPNMPLPMWG